LFDLTGRGFPAPARRDSASWAVATTTTGSAFKLFKLFEKNYSDLWTLFAIRLL
jgi:hypothetical protein